MAQETAVEDGSRTTGRKRHVLSIAIRIFAISIVVMIAIAWFQRETIADNFIADALAENDTPATYQIERISPQQQVLTDIVIGDPDRPDLTIERLVLDITPRWGFPEVTRVTVVRPRAYGSYREGELSFGALDPYVFSEEEDGGAVFPDLELFIEDGRALLDSDFGRIGLSLDGGGHLRGGFNAELAAVGEEIALGGCSVDAPTLYGTASVDAERPHFVGPLRFDALECRENDLALQDGAVQLDVFAHRNFVDFEGDFDARFAGVDYTDVAAGAIGGEGRFSWRDGRLNALYDVSLADVASGAGGARQLTVEGRVRAVDQFARVDVEGDVSGEGLVLGRDLDGALANARAASEGTLAAPLIAQIRSALLRELPGSELVAAFEVRKLGQRTSVIVPEARLRGGSGATLLALSRVQLGMGDSAIPSFSGNLQTSGLGLPLISGRMEQGQGGALELRLAMREYAAGDSRVAIPRLAVLQDRAGRIAFQGEVVASGALPGGTARGLRLPVDGTVDQSGAIALWNGCRDIAFDGLAISNLTLSNQSLTLCPPRGRSILRYGDEELRVAAGVSSLDLRGELAETPIRLRSGAVGMAYPGALAASDLDILLGPPDNGQRFTISDLRADLSGDSIGGEFAGADVFLAPVPLDILGANGSWSYTDDGLQLTDARFMVEDREETDRFEPLLADGAELTLFDNRITATSNLRHPESMVMVSRVRLAHDLTDSSGSADLSLAGLTFSENFQPTDLSQLALGVVANVRGTIFPSARINWNESGVTSTGEFSSRDLDFAAPFGPVEGASGRVVFTDLLGMTTAPDQRIQLASINPGIEIYDGEMGFQLIDGERLLITGGQWPFMGGTLSMRPTEMNIGVEEFRTYTMDIEGLQAARFIERMELSNLAATGTFDGTIPIVFDPDGNGQLVSGELVARPPGGNLSYIGELTYEDMGFFANYAFQTLRDLQYDSMEIDMNGPLTGELVTQVRFEGIRQGPTAERNFVSRAIADLPIELRINIRAPFYQLMTSVRSLYDPAAVRDPRDLGLIEGDGAPSPEEPDGRIIIDELLNEPKPDIQPPESEAMR
ncbi:intermembrane phospholipid transport protein YdbH family protein [Aurantiacibacter sp. MUD61]|uniref:intermembrane phospholipid transport protein YdbH family protein n=1 Tax=Aurantiacibacter sp. MUD61 TaxID=3009083 RepID=UPI0022F048D1|nr:YdbH domain-containing protein [Aurantiacibacter sp. MUD61]